MGQSLSALVSTSFQHVSACRRCHSFTEAVYLALLSFLGLISSFHNISPVLDFLFFSFMAGTKNIVFPATLHIIPKTTFLVKRFFLVFKRRKGFLRLFFCLVVHFNGHHQILTAVFRQTLYRVGGHRRVEGQHRLFAVERLQRL